MTARPAAIVTGSSRGLGRAFAVALAQAGYDIVVNGTSHDAVEETAILVEGFGARAVRVLGSVAEMDTCDELVLRCASELGRVDVLVNNAGITRDRSLLKMTAAEFDEVIGVHLRGAWACTSAAGRVMREQRRGSIVNITSGSGLYGMYGQSNYAAAKAGVIGLTRVSHLELGRFGIRCNALAPVARTAMTSIFDDASAEQPRHARVFPPPETVAPLVVHLVSESARRVAGQVLSFDGTDLATWTHPEQSCIRTSSGGWTGADFDRALSEMELELLHPDVWGRGVAHD